MLRPWRSYIPSSENKAFHRRVKELDAYVIGLLRNRRALRSTELAEHGKVCSRLHYECAVDGAWDGVMRH